MITATSQISGYLGRSDEEFDRHLRDEGTFQLYQRATVAHVLFLVWPRFLDCNFAVTRLNANTALK